MLSYPLVYDFLNIISNESKCVECHHTKPHNQRRVKYSRGDAQHRGWLTPGYAGKHYAHIKYVAIDQQQ